MGMHSQVIFHPQPLPTPPEISAPYAAGFFKTVYDDRAAADADTITYYEKGEAYYIWCEADATTTEDAKIYTCTAAGTTATGTFTTTKPISNCIYQRLDTLEIMQFYLIEPDMENPVSIIDINSRYAISQGLSLISMPRNTYILGKYAGKTNLNIVSNRVRIYHTNCEMTVTYSMNFMTTTLTEYTIPIKTNGLYMYVAAENNHLIGTVGFKAAGA